METLADQLTGINLIVLVAVASAMLYLFFKDLNSQGTSVHTDFKSVLVSLGIAGTFIGIFLGLWDFDTTDIQKSVPELLEGLKVAFITSILGMGMAIGLSVNQTLKHSGFSSEDRPLATIESLLRDLTVLPKQNETLIETLNSIRGENSNATNDLKRLIADNFKTTNSSLEEALTALSEGASKEIIQALEQVITDFNDNLKEQFGENFKQLNEAVKELVVWQDNYKEHVQLTDERVDKTLKEVEGFNGSLERITDNSSALKELVNDLGDTIKTSTFSAEELKKSHAK